MEMQATACYTSVLKFVLHAGDMCGTATHAVGGDAGYGLLYGVATHAVGRNAGYSLLSPARR